MDTRFLALGVIALGLHGQQTVTRVVFVAVTDSVNRFVTGLEHSHFAISENGLQRPIVSIATPDEAVAIAIVTDHDIPIGAAAREGAELHQVRSVAEALRSLASSSAARKALVVATGEEAENVPDHIFVQRAAPADVQRAAVAARSRYVIAFSSANATASPVVVLNPPRGLPALKAVY
jgi:hypothetical protein